MSDNLQSNLIPDDVKDQDEILKELNDLVSSNSIKVTEESLSLKSANPGYKLPLIINICTIAAVVFTIFITNTLYKENQKKLNIQTMSYSTAEGKLLKELKQQTEEKLAKKEEEINNVKSQMEEINKQSQELKANMDEQIAEKKAELTAQMQTELEAERQRLLAAGRTEEYIQEQLEKMEAKRRLEMESQLNQFKAESQKLLAEKEAELEQARKINEQILADMNAERKRIQEETKQREIELTQKKEAEMNKLSTVQEEMKQLALNRENESLILDQIYGSYKSIFTAIDSSNYEEALSSIQSLEKIISSPEIMQYENIADRNNIDFNILSALKSIIKIEQNKDKSKQLTDVATLLLSSRESVGAGDSAYNSNDLETAKAKYEESIRSLPLINRAWQNIEAISIAETENKVNKLLDEAQRYFSSGNISEAIDIYVKAASIEEREDSKIHQKAVEELLKAVNMYNRTEIAKLESANKEYSKKIELLQKESENLNSKLPSLANKEEFFNEGSNSVLTDIYKIITNFNGKEITDPELEKQVKEKSEENPLYAQTVSAVFNVVAGTPENIEELFFNKPVLIGTVNYTADGFIYIEPISERELETGAKVIIKRREINKEIYICNGTIDSAASGRIIVNEKCDINLIKVMDLVYINSD